MQNNRELSGKYSFEVTNQAINGRSNSEAEQLFWVISRQQPWTELGNLREPIHMFIPVTAHGRSSATI